MFSRRETRGGLKGIMAEVQKGAALLLSCKSSVRNLLKLSINDGHVSQPHVNKPGASEEHADRPVGLGVGNIQQQLDVKVVTRGKL